VLSTFAYALDVDLFCFSQFTAVFALGDGTAFFLNLEEGAISVFAVGRAMALDASLAGQAMREGGGDKEEDRPGVFLATDEDLDSRGIKKSGETRKEVGIP
jgi:hypothetical protein